MKGKTADLALIIAFVGLMVAFGLLSFVMPANQVSTEENRQLSPLPKLRLKQLQRFPSAFEAFVDDRMPFRTAFTKGASWVKVNCLGVSTSTAVGVGNRGWLYFVGEGSLSEVRHEQPFTGAEIHQWEQALAERTAWMKNLGVKYVFVVVPDKSSVYPEWLPQSLLPVRPESRLEQLTNRLNNRRDITFINLAPELIKHKGGQPLYYRTDTHWNEAGAYYGCLRIIAAVRPYYPVVNSFAALPVRFVVMPFASGDLAALLGLKGLLRDESLSPRVDGKKLGEVMPAPDVGFGTKEQVLNAGGQQLPSVMVFQDSMGDFLRPYFGRLFSKATYCRQDGVSIDRALIQHEKPDIVIQEVVERTFVQCTPWSAEDWRAWVVNTISENGGGAGWLNILPETSDISVLRFQRIKLPENCAVRPLSPRHWTAAGEKVEFNEKEALYSDWYLLKTGPQGSPLINQESEQAYQKLNDYVRINGHFKEVAELPMPDGNHISLYKQIAPGVLGH
jgi:hypothetical protein